MKRYVVLVRTSNTWCFSGGEFGHMEPYFVIAHDPEQAIMLLVHERKLEAWDKAETYEAYELAESAGRHKLQKKFKPKPLATKELDPNTLCMCAFLKDKGLKGSCSIHQ